MSETTATPQAPVSSGNDFVSLADAVDAGFDSINKAAETPSVSTTPTATTISTPEVAKPSEPIVNSKSDASEKTNPLDILTKRLTGKEESLTDSKKDLDSDLDIKTPENLKPEAQTAWARLTKDLRDARAKLKDLETKMSDTSNTSVEQASLQSQLDTLKSERDEYENELKFSRLESTREYKQAVTEPLTSLQKEVADIAALYENIDPRNLYVAMAESDPAKRRALLKEATSAFDPVDSLAVRNKAEELHKVFARRDILTKDVNTVLQLIESEEKQQQEAFQKKTQAEIQTAYQSEWENMQKENALLRPIEGNEQWNNTIQNIQKQALDIENTELDSRSKARLTFNAAAMPVVMNVFQDYVSKTQSRISELEQLAKDLRSSLPSSGGSKESAVDVPADLGFLEALERGLK
jgi:hypothetical protein